jgi:hypothetical protein
MNLMNKLFPIVKKQPQLSVIVVPVSFIILAMVIVVFGVALFIQNRRR